LPTDTALDRRLINDLSSHILWVMATFGKEEDPQRDVLESPPMQYSHKVFSLSSKVSSGISDSSQLIRQVAQPPPETWLTEIGVTKTEFIQQSLDMFTVVLYSLLDRCLHLTNIILSSELKPRNVTYDRLSKKLKSNHSVVATALSDLKDAVSPLAEPRHFFVHRGEGRESRLSHTQLLATIQKQLPALIDPAKIDYATARVDIMVLIQKDFETVSACVRKVKNVLFQPYMSKLNALGGIPELTKDELLRAKDIMNWAETGIEPPWSKKSR